MPPCVATHLSVGICFQHFIFYALNIMNYLWDFLLCEVFLCCISFAGTSSPVLSKPLSLFILISFPSLSSYGFISRDSWIVVASTFPYQQRLLQLHLHSIPFSLQALSLCIYSTHFYLCWHFLLLIIHCYKMSHGFISLSQEEGNTTMCSAVCLRTEKRCAVTNHRQTLKKQHDWSLIMMHIFHLHSYLCTEEPVVKFVCYVSYISDYTMVTEIWTIVLEDRCCLAKPR